jgi:hypothetical protein
MNISEIKQQLEWGDMDFIAKSTGYSKEMVRKVLAGDRNNNRIVEAAKILVDGKKSLKDQISIMAGL